MPQVVAGWFSAPQPLHHPTTNILASVLIGRNGVPAHNVFYLTTDVVQASLKGNIMKISSRVLLLVSAAIISAGVAPAAFAQDKMGKEETTKDTMSKDGMKKDDAMSKDAMKKDDAMSKDGMKKDEMKK